jgi:hypothetical protein
VLPIEKIKLNIHNLVNFKGKSHKIKLTPANTSKVDKSTNVIGSVPSLNDMEFNWMDDY